MKTDFISRFLEKILAIMWVVVFILFIGTTGYIIYDLIRDFNVYILVFGIINICANFFILYTITELRKILKRVLDKKPFVRSNVTSFKRIGFSSFGIAALILIRLIIDIKGSDPFDMFFLNASAMNYKGGFLMFLIFGCLALVLSEIFRLAVEIKEENDLTV
ncbi:DUF2975 family protein [Natranaerovirga hydrolytica]|uniref:DUF2975 family protein n=1 Tax=Natranaerovirga hydrolytica TaxID=680378 RepID=A0A4R1MLQ1_9FIRM|nr:DUF2975 domain-containing protein [Natranaerovirga hydrolytica]TCK92792.1 DUF2975 family protein [Natranaerovirga hydrolytica]